MDDCNFCEAKSANCAYGDLKNSTSCIEARIKKEEFEFPQKFPYECIIKETKEEFVPTIIDYDNQQVWNQTAQTSESGEWYSFDEVIFKKNKNFKELS